MVKSTYLILIGLLSILVLNWFLDLFERIEFSVDWILATW